MQIAPGTNAHEWKNLNFGQVAAWEAAVSIFDRRIRGRFLNAIDFLIADDEPRPATERRWGFAALTLDCPLVETLQASRDGLTDTRGRSKELSVRFLTERAAFKPFFTSSALATRFCYEFRCGLAHNAQVFGDGLVWSIGPVIKMDGTKIVVNRTAFHEALVAELDGYLT